MSSPHLDHKRRVWLIPAVFIPLLAITCALGDSLTAQRPETSKNVLIANGGSYLENAVSAFVGDSLSTKGYTVKIIRLESLKAEQTGTYRATIIMNAVKSSKLKGVVRAYARSLGAAQSNIIICTVYGEDYKSGKTLSDAVSAATTTLDPAAIASKIVRGIASIATPR